MIPYYSDGLATIYHGDCLDVLDGLEDRPDLVFTSPPYNLGVSAGGGFGHYTDDAGIRQRGGGGKWTGGALAHGYTDHGDDMPHAEYEQWQQRVLAALYRQLAPDGAIYYNHKPRVQALELWTPLRLLASGMHVRQIIIWARGGGMNFAPTHYVPTHEWIVVIAKPDFRLKSKGASGVGDVWTIGAETGNNHPAPFPVALPARAIETVAPRLVLDPFVGSGSTLIAAKQHGVRAIGIDKSEAYCEMAALRLAQATLFEPDPLHEQISFDA